jgi:hypothetical protein
MGGTALASVLHVAGFPLPSHCCCPIVVIQLPLSNYRPQIAAVIDIYIIAVGGGSGIVTITIAIIVAITVAISAIAVVAVIVNIASFTLLPNHCCCHAPWRPRGGAGPNHATQALPMAC